MYDDHKYRTESEPFAARLLGELGWKESTQSDCRTEALQSVHVQYMYYHQIEVTVHRLGPPFLCRLHLFSSHTHAHYLSLACLPHYTSGQTYYYPAFNAARPEDAVKFAREFGEVLAMPIMLEAVMRVRASRGERTPSIRGA